MTDNHSHEQGAVEGERLFVQHGIQVGDKVHYGPRRDWGPGTVEAVGEELIHCRFSPPHGSFQYGCAVANVEPAAALPASAPVDGGLEAENARLRNYARRVSIAFTACSGGGSEMFTQIDGEFYADPEACRTRVEEKFHHRRAETPPKPAPGDVAGGRDKIAKLVCEHYEGCVDWAAAPKHWKASAYRAADAILAALTEQATPDADRDDDLDKAFEALADGKTIAQLETSLTDRDATIAALREGLELAHDRFVSIAHTRGRREYIQARARGGAKIAAALLANDGGSRG